MPRRPYQPAREDIRPEEREAYDRVIARQTNYGYERPKGTEAGPHFGALLQAPVIADALSELGVYYRSRGEQPDSFQHWHREWTDMVIGKDMSLPIMWGHILDGVASGMRPEGVKALWEGREWDLNREELMLTVYIRQFCTGTITPQSYDAIEDLLGVRAAVEFTAWIGHLQLTARVQAANNPQGWGADFKKMIDERIASLFDGTAELPEGPRFAKPL